MAKETVTKQEPVAEEEGATVEEIDDEEAKKIEALQELRKRQQEAKDKPKEVVKKTEGEEVRQVRFHPPLLERTITGSRPEVAPRE